MKLHIVSFGQSGYYNKIAITLVNNIKHKYKNSITRVYSDLDLPIELLSFANKYPTGFGYWKWKPLILLIHQEHMDYGDVLLYLDGRTHFDSESIKWLDEFITDDNSDFLAWQLPFKELDFTGIDQFQELNAIQQHIINTPQFAGGLFAFKKNHETIELIKLWSGLLNINLLLFTNELIHRNISTNEVIETRNDQSAFSLLLKINSVGIKLKIITDSEIYSDKSVKPQFMYKKSIFANYANFLKIKLPLFHRFSYYLYKLFKRFLKIWYI